MAEELELQQEEEDSGLSTGAQLGVAAFFMGLPVIGMGFEALGWGEIGLVAAGLAAGGMGIGTKFLIDRKKQTSEDGDEERPGFTQSLAQITGLDRLQYADWGALVRPSGMPAPARQIAAPSDDPNLATQYKGVAQPDFDDDDELPPPSPVGANDRFTFSQMLARFTPSMDQIFLGLLTDGTPVYVKAEDLCHVALAGNTGGGKSSLLRMIMAQLCYAGAHVLLLNPHYTPYDRKHDEDWTPYLPHLEKPADECARYENIRVYLQWMAETLLPRRIERVRAGKLAGRPYFVILDELPDVISEIKEAPKYIGDLLRQGRKYDIYLVVASQDFLAKTVAGEEGGAVRKMYRTGLYVGGDATTAKVLLDMPPKDIPENLLGKGTVMLRCAATKKAVMARVPYLDNRALYTLLGESTFVIPDEDERDESFPAISKDGPTRNSGDEDVNGMEMAPEAGSGNVISGVFPLPGKEIPKISRSDLPVSDDKLEMIRQMKDRKYQDSEIAVLVKLSGRKYTIYQQCLIYLGYKLAKEG